MTWKFPIYGVCTDTNAKRGEGRYVVTEEDVGGYLILERFHSLKAARQCLADLKEMCPDGGTYLLPKKRKP